MGARSSAGRQGHRPSPLGDAAVELAERGFYIFPCGRDKEPLTAHGCHDASASLPVIEAWWARWPRANLAIACGPSRLVVIDLDGWAAQSTWAALEEVHGACATLMSQTGRIGGLHLVFSDEAAQGRNTAGRIGPQIDSKAAGGYVICPPSIHENGRRYDWVGDYRHPAPVPDWVLARLRPPPPPKPEADPPLDPDSPLLAHARLEGVARRVAETQPGARHQVLFWGAATVGELVAAGLVSEHHARWSLDRACQKNGLADEDPQDVARTIADGFARGGSK